MFETLEPWLGSYESASPCEGVCPTGVRVEFDEAFSFTAGDEWIHYDQRAVATAREFILTDEGCEKHLWLADGEWPELTHHMWGRFIRVANGPDWPRNINYLRRN